MIKQSSHSDSHCATVSVVLIRWVKVEPASRQLEAETKAFP